MELPSLDLNLIVVLHALLRERNVTRAGEQVGLSQPGASAALARLRRHFGDELLVREGSRYQLTPLAEGLLDEVGDVVEHLGRLLAAQPDFQPATAERAFVLQCSDSVLDVLGPSLIRAVTSAAPNVRLDFRSVNGVVVTDPVAVLRAVDLLIMPRGLFSLPEMPSEELYTDEWVCLTWEGNDTIGDRLSAAEAKVARWIMPFRQVVQASPADAAFNALGIDRQCAVQVESFTTLGRLVAGTTLLTLAHARVCRLHPVPGLREVALPVAVPPLVETVWWHPRKRLDPGHQWLRELVLGQAKKLRAEQVG